MSEKVVEELFASLFALTDLRQILRETKPTYNLNEIQRHQVREIVESVRVSLSVIEEAFLK